jgi:hypothetical protein
MGTIEPLNFLSAAKSLELPPVAIVPPPGGADMKRQILISLFLSLLAANAFALPNLNPQPLLGEVKDSQPEIQLQDRHVAEGGTERLLQQRLRTAENGTARTPGQQRLRLAEGGTERLLEQRHAG